MALSLKEFSDGYDERLKKEIAEIPAKVAAMSSEFLVKEQQYFASRGIGCEYDRIYAEAIDERYFRKLGEHIEKHPIHHPGKKGH